METSKCIVQVRVGESATVRVLRISPNEVITCDRHCACLKEAEDGSIQCSIGWIKKMVNFQTTALVIDYEVIMDRAAEWDWPICGANFSVIDEMGQIHKGEQICKDIVSPKGLSGGIDWLYPGTKGQFRVYYETFPRDGRIASIIAQRIGDIQGRIDFMSEEPQDSGFAEEQRKMVLTPMEPDEMRERIEILEKEVKTLKRYVNLLKSICIDQNNDRPVSQRPMFDSGIEYHPLDKK